MGGGLPRLIEVLHVAGEYLHELVDHQEVPHGLDDVVVPPNRQHHVVNPLLQQRHEYTNDEDGKHADVPADLEDRVIRVELAD